MEITKEEKNYIKNDVHVVEEVIKIKFNDDLNEDEKRSQAKLFLNSLYGKFSAEKETEEKTARNTNVLYSPSFLSKSFHEKFLNSLEKVSREMGLHEVYAIRETEPPVLVDKVCNAMGLDPLEYGYLCCDALKFVIIMCGIKGGYADSYFE